MKDKKEMKEEMQEMKMKGKKNAKKEGKMCALRELRDLASSMMGDDLDEMKKVTVAAKDKKGLQAGLKKAQELVGKKS